MSLILQMQNGVQWVFSTLFEMNPSGAAGSSFSSSSVNMWYLIYWNGKKVINASVVDPLSTSAGLSSSCAMHQSWYSSHPVTATLVHYSFILTIVVRCSYFTIHHVMT
jgi:hypothetical protein